MTSKYLIYLTIISAALFFSCRATKKIETAIVKKELPPPPTPDNPKPKPQPVNTDNTSRKNDSMQVIKKAYTQLQKKYINFKTFNSRIDVAYQGPDKKKYNLDVVLRMQKDSVIWISVNAFIIGEAARLLITKDSVKLLKKINENTYLSRSISYLQELTMLPLNLSTLQDLLIGNPVFIDSGITAYVKPTFGNKISLVHYGDFFKNFLTLIEPDFLIENCKLDDLDPLRSRTCNMFYSDFAKVENKNFSTKRHITVAEKTKLDIQLVFKSYSFNQPVSFPFAVPKNYKIE